MSQASLAARMPPLRGASVVKLVRAPARGPLDAVLLSDRPEGVWTHYYESLKRTRPCFGEGCCCGETGLWRRWIGYAAAAVSEGGQPQYRILELTQGACGVLGAYFAEGPESVRGWWIRLHRDDKVGIHAVHVELVKKIAPESIPPAFDLRPRLLRLWQLNGPDEKRIPVWDYPWGVPPPAPPATTEAAKEGQDND